MIFEKYNSQQVYFDAGTLYFLVLQCIHHFHSFMNSNVSRYTRHSTIHWNAPNVSKFIVAFQRTPLNKSYIQTICISTFYIRGVGVYDANMNFNEIFYIQGRQTSQCIQSLHVFFYHKKPRNILKFTLCTSCLQSWLAPLGYSTQKLDIARMRPCSYSQA